MSVRIQISPRLVVVVDCRASDCPLLSCFFPSRHTIYTGGGSNGHSTNDWECGFRDQTGCPKDKTRSAPPRYRKRGSVWKETP